MKRKPTSDCFIFYVLLFFITAFVGWLWEVLLFLFTEHAFINRGVYEGPYLPIYGAGGFLLCVLLSHIRKKPLLVFVLSMTVCTVLEYLTSFFLERKWGIRWCMRKKQEIWNLLSNILTKKDGSDRRIRNTGSRIRTHGAPGAVRDENQ